MAKYFSLIARRATNRTLELIGIGSWPRLLFRAATTILAIFIVAYFSSDKAADRATFAVVSVAATLALAAVGFIWAIAKSAAEVYEDQRKEIERLTSTRKLEANEIVAQLTRLFERGEEILGKYRITHSDNIDDFISEYEAWCQETESIIRQGVSESEAFMFRSIAPTVVSLPKDTRFFLESKLGKLRLITIRIMEKEWPAAG